jgi:hypothetical protein
VGIVAYVPHVIPAAEFRGRERHARRTGRADGRTAGQARLIEFGAKATRRSKYVTLQLAEVVAPRQLFAAISDRIGRLAMQPAAYPSG